MQGGDVTKKTTGDGQMSVYGPSFEDENFVVKHDSLGEAETTKYVVLVLLRNILKERKFFPTLSYHMSFVRFAVDGQRGSWHQRQPVLFHSSTCAKNARRKTRRVWPHLQRRIVQTGEQTF